MEATSDPRLIRIACGIKWYITKTPRRECLPLTWDLKVIDLGALMEAVSNLVSNALPAASNVRSSIQEPRRRPSLILVTNALSAASNGASTEAVSDLRPECIVRGIKHQFINSGTSTEAFSEPRTHYPRHQMAY